VPLNLPALFSLQLLRFVEVLLTSFLLQALAGMIANAPSPHEAAMSRMQDLQALLSE
jgi:hypothetical protein